MRAILWCAAASIIGIGMTAQHRPDNAPADLIVVNGKVYTADAVGAFAQAVAVRGNTIAAVGTAAEIERLRGPNTEVVDAGGGAVVPGFNDVHTHMLSGGLAMENVQNDLWHGIDAVQNLLRHRVPAWLPGRPLINLFQDCHRSS